MTGDKEGEGKNLVSSPGVKWVILYPSIEKSGGKVMT
jgi:hypothetical protein